MTTTMPKSPTTSARAASEKAVPDSAPMTMTTRLSTVVMARRESCGRCWPTSRPIVEPTMIDETLMTVPAPMKIWGTTAPFHHPGAEGLTRGARGHRTGAPRLGLTACCGSLMCAGGGWTTTLPCCRAVRSIDGIDGLREVSGESAHVLLKCANLSLRAIHFRELLVARVCHL